MSRLIDAEALKRHYSWWKGGSREMTMDEAKADFDIIVDLQPTVEKRGKWERVEVTTEVAETLGCGYDAEVVKCSHCGNLEFTASNYCRRCGAKMW